jgi:uncharacterized protein (UPF0332 family)
MFDIARAALLSSGLRDDELPRTHNGLIAAFSKYAVQPGRIDQKLSGALGRTESLRLMADYTGTPLDAKTASDTVTRAESFLIAVEREFGLDESHDLGKDNQHRQEQASERSSTQANDAEQQTLKPFPLEEMQRRARENWLKLRQQNLEEAEKGLSPSPARGLENDDGHSVDKDPE